MTRSRQPRPEKPYPGFPLTPHPCGMWVKKIRGKIHYFGKWATRVDGVLTRVPGDGAKEAEEAYNAVRDDLHAGRTPRVRGIGLTVAELCDRFLQAKLRNVEAGELSSRQFAEHREITNFCVSDFGANRLVDDLAADDFGQLRAAMARKWGPVRLGNGITRTKSVFKFGYESGLMERPVRYGPEFKKPNKAVLRKHRAKMPPKMFEAVELRAIIDGMLVVGEAGPELVKPDASLRAMILLGVNCGFGNTDCAELSFTGLDLADGWVDFPRPKTGIARRCPLWPGTVAAIRAAVALRPRPVNSEDCGRVFLNARGSAYVSHSKSGARTLSTSRTPAPVRRGRCPTRPRSYPASATRRFSRSATRRFAPIRRPAVALAKTRQKLRSAGTAAPTSSRAGIASRVRAAAGAFRRN